jgi:hypothetical protein
VRKLSFLRHEWSILISTPGLASEPSTETPPAFASNDGLGRDSQSPFTTGIRHGETLCIILYYDIIMYYERVYSHFHTAEERTAPATKGQKESCVGGV